MQRSVSPLGRLITNPRLVLSMVPALISLLFMPDGAMLSAPMIEEIGRQQGLSAERKTYHKGLFWHLWQHIFTLYPALILLSGMLRIPLSRLMLAEAPLTPWAPLLAVHRWDCGGLDGRRRPRPQPRLRSDGTALAGCP